jgi:hypothetical protein
MEKKCDTCIKWRDVHIQHGKDDSWKVGFCYENQTNTLADMTCPRFGYIALELPEALKKWKPIWKDTRIELPECRKLVLMWYSGEPTQKTGFVINDIWYKAAGSTTPPPDFWTELP